jgi:hypothetical protein
MHSFQRKRVIDHTEHDEHDHLGIWVGQWAVLQNLPLDDSEHIAFFAAASGNAKLLALLVETGWVPFSGTLFFAVLWELGRSNPFAPGWNDPQFMETPTVPSPAERTAGVVDIILSMPVPPLLKKMMILEDMPHRVRSLIPFYSDWSPDAIALCSVQPPQCTAASRILRKILALRTARSHVYRNFKRGLGFCFQGALRILKTHPQSTPNVVHAWLEAAGDLVLRGDAGNADSNAIPVCPDWWPAFDRHDWAALENMIDL